MLLISICAVVLLTLAEQCIAVSSNKTIGTRDLIAVLNNTNNTLPPSPETIHENEERRDKRLDSLSMASSSLYPRRTVQQGQMQFNQNNLPDNQHDSTNLNRLLWQQFHRQNNRPNNQSPTDPNYSSLFNLGRLNTLPSQESQQLNPVYVIGKPYDDEQPGSVEPVVSFLNNVRFDLLDDHPGYRPDLFNSQNDNNVPQELSKKKMINVPILESFLSAIGNSLRESTSVQSCSLVVKALPIVLIGSLQHAISLVNRMRLSGILIAPIVVLGALNFVAASLYLQASCGEQSA